MVTQIGLVLGDHPASECEMKRPGRSDYGVKQSAVGLHVVKNAEQAINRDGENAVERKKIRRERDPKIGAVGQYMTAVPAVTEPADAPAHSPNPTRQRH